LPYAKWQQKVGLNEFIFYRGLLKLQHTQNGYRGHKLNLLSDCPKICTTKPVYYQVAICQMATKSWAEMNSFSTGGTFEVAIGEMAIGAIN
jgi:hypothetical protein